MDQIALNNCTIYTSYQRNQSVLTRYHQDILVVKLVNQPRIEFYKSKKIIITSWMAAAIKTIWANLVVEINIMDKLDDN